MHAVKLLSLDILKPHPRNVRTHSKKQIRQIADSIVAYGFTVPVLADEKFVLLAGHGRLEAAKLLGLKKLPAIVLEGLSTIVAACDVAQADRVRCCDLDLERANRRRQATGLPPQARKAARHRSKRDQG